jgi:DNA-binding transcriptional regulator LsrR (DeoR family)
MILELSRSMIGRAGTAPIEKYSSQLEFVQTCGDPQSVIENPEISSHHHVAELNRHFSTKSISRYVFSLGASIPLNIRDEEIPVIRRYMEQVGGYADIFTIDKKSRKQRLNVDLDVLITSCGSGRVANDSWAKDCVATGVCKKTEIENMVQGNIGGIWISKDGLDDKHKELIKKINDRWIGMTYDDVKKISENAPQEGGVVLIAAEDFKAEIVKDLVEKRLVSQLIISDLLADKLEKMV